MTNNLNEKLKYVDSYTLNDLANYMEKQAEELRAQAAEQAINQSEKNSFAVDHIIRTPRIVMRYLKTGCTLIEAKTKAANDCSLPIGTIDNAWSRFCMDKSNYELKRRNRLILELACLGFTNSDIGKKVGLHPNSVSRIITKARRDYHTGTRANPIELQMLLNGGMSIESQINTA